MATRLPIVFALRFSPISSRPKSAMKDCCSTIVPTRASSIPVKLESAGSINNVVVVKLTSGDTHRAKQDNGIPKSPSKATKVLSERRSSLSDVVNPWNRHAHGLLRSWLDEFYPEQMSPKMDVDGLLVWLTGDSICNLSYVYVTY
jgi:hypothetical protein